ncbi:MAG: SdiA-regulated domain-containing protein [Zoogloeaceae bacterium]|nr:SdiA-regulated domain-containing protein [Zoogloeaceae bacterium]
MGHQENLFLRRAAIVLTLAALFAFLASSQLFDRGWFALRTWHNATEWQSRSLWLPDYRVTLEAQVIDANLANISALTYDPVRKSLFSVTNQHPEVIELSLQGHVLRRIPLHGFGDAEAIEYIAPGLFVISDERQQRLFKVRIADDTVRLDSAGSKQFSLGIGRNGNKGFEGLAYDPVGNRLFVAKERDPMRIYEISGFPLQQGPGISLEVLDNRERDRRLFVRDLSSLHYDSRTGHLLALSDESRMVVEIDAGGHPISTLSLKRGRHGLHSDVPQAEGVALDGDGNLYVVSEPNLFYVFRKR